MSHVGGKKRDYNLCLLNTGEPYTYRHPSHHLFFLQIYLLVSLPLHLNLTGKLMMIFVQVITPQ